eukprot:Transcript_6334.p2 GENE.Transcript_6334~~Transcript_6334.p2  ORF type:complete len:525 (-),score=220.09 Transcript_6334:116-1690(-)
MSACRRGTRSGSGFSSSNGAIGSTAIGSPRVAPPPPGSDGNMKGATPCRLTAAAGSLPPAGGAADEEGGEGGGGGGGGAGGKEPAAAVSLQGVAPFMFPSEPGGGGATRGEPIAVEPIAPFDELKPLPLRVPRRHADMGYSAQAFASPGSFPTLETQRPLRQGAAGEAGRPLPSGEPSLYSTVPMPPQLLQYPPPPPSPLAETKGFDETALDEVSAAAPAAAPAAEGEGEGEGEAGAPAAVAPKMAPPSVSVAAALRAKAEGSNNFLTAPTGTPRVHAPPEYTEIDAAMQLRAQPVTPNLYWKTEEVGSSTGIALLRVPTISSRWRLDRDPWPDAKVAIPRPMKGPRDFDTREELSSDESDTEIEHLVQPVTEQRLREIFVIPDQYGRFPNEIPPEESQAGGGEGEGEGEGEAGAPPPPKYRAGFGPVEVPSEGLHCGPTLDGGRVPPERVLPLDMGSELAVAEAALQAEYEQKRKEDRERLTNSLAELNQYIPDTHMKYQLDITSLNGRQHPPGQPAVPKKAE